MKDSAHKPKKTETKGLPIKPLDKKTSDLIAANLIEYKDMLDYLKDK